MAAPATRATDKDLIADRLAEARERTLTLVEPLDEAQLNRVYSELLSPLAWDLGHIANFEELWLVQTVGGREPLVGDMGRLYDAIENPRSGRNELPILRDRDLRAYMADVRERTLEVLEAVELDDTADPLLRNALVYEMLIAHEHQHNETMLQLLQMVDGYERPSLGPDPRSSLLDREAATLAKPEMVEIPRGSYEIGAAASGFAYDNERDRHRVELASFAIDRHPVSNHAYCEFIADTGAEPPMYWRADGAGGWIDTRFGDEQPLGLDEVVVHVSFDDASAFAGWAGKRLPSEFEWEVAAGGIDDSAPANLDHLAWGTAPVGSLPRSGSDFGVVQMLGDVWEWTSSELSAYPGFEPFPYPDYSQVFFDRGYKVLRGGSWATRRGPALRTSFRNWDLPIRRQIFAGFRCAQAIEDGG
ncbi:MAG: SUMF1/EgtB/PvdO family nonheme iron enzyme [Solirubrobacterales bacterium]